jgi:hypothetical protein
MHVPTAAERDPAPAVMNTGASRSTAESSAAETRPAAWTARLAYSAVGAWPALALYAATRLLTLAVLAVWGRHTGEGLGKVLGDFDGGHYVLIADHGYGAVAGGKEMALFPLYPMMIRFLGWISPLSTVHTAILLTWIASLAAAWAIYSVGTHVADRRTGILLAGLWGVAPHAMVESMAYSEPLFTALAAWALLALLRRSWLTAAALTVLAGLTRPSAVALIGVVGLAALIAVIRRQDGWRPWIAVITAPLGWLAYVGWVGARTGRVDGWFHIQRTVWHTYFDGGASAWKAAVKALTTASPLDHLMVTLVLACAVVLLAIGVIDRQPWQLLLFSAVLLVASVTAANYYNAKARLILPAFALLLPVARALARTRTGKAVLIFGFLATISAYFGGYLAFVWPYSP